MTTHVRDHVRQGTVRPEAAQPVQIMWHLRYPTICGPVGCCSHVQCATRIEQAMLRCYRCDLLILPGEMFYPVHVIDRRVVTQVHTRCEDEARQ